jgi:hypothetical protein
LNAGASTFPCYKKTTADAHTWQHSNPKLKPRGFRQIIRSQAVSLTMHRNALVLIEKYANISAA